MNLQNKLKTEDKTTMPTIGLNPSESNDSAFDKSKSIEKTGEFRAPTNQNSFDYGQNFGRKPSTDEEEDEFANSLTHFAQENDEANELTNMQSPD